MASQTLREKIKALVARAESIASSPAEVEAAMSRANDLMQKHGLTLDDVAGEDAEPVLVAEGEIVTGRVLKTVGFFVPSLARFCGVRSFRTWETYSRHRQLNWVGYGPDIDLAQYLFGVITEAIRTESRKHQPAKSRDDFACAMAARIGMRLRELSDLRQPTAVGGGKDLIAVKDAAIDEAFDQLGIGKARRRATRSIDETVFDAGRKAGDRVGLHRPVSGERGKLALPAS